MTFWHIVLPNAEDAEDAVCSTQSNHAARIKAYIYRSIKERFAVI